MLHANQYMQILTKPHCHQTTSHEKMATIPYTIQNQYNHKVLITINYYKAKPPIDYVQSNPALLKHGPLSLVFEGCLYVWAAYLWRRSDAWEQGEQSIDPGAMASGIQLLAGCSTRSPNGRRLARIEVDVAKSGGGWGKWRPGMVVVEG